MIVFTVAMAPSASSISTMWVPISRIGCSRRTLRRSMLQVAGVADRVGDLLGTDRAEELAVLAGPLVDRQHSL